MVGRRQGEKEGDKLFCIGLRSTTCERRADHIFTARSPSSSTAGCNLRQAREWGMSRWGAVPTTLTALPVPLASTCSPEAGPVAAADGRGPCIARQSLAVLSCCVEEQSETRPGGRLGGSAFRPKPMPFGWGRASGGPPGLALPCGEHGELAMARAARGFLVLVKWT